MLQQNPPTQHPPKQPTPLGHHAALKLCELWTGAALSSCSSTAEHTALCCLRIWVRQSSGRAGNRAPCPRATPQAIRHCRAHSDAHHPLRSPKPPHTDTPATKHLQRKNTGEAEKLWGFFPTRQGRSMEAGK